MKAACTESVCNWKRCYGSLMDSLCDMPKLTETNLRRMFRLSDTSLTAAGGGGAVNTFFGFLMPADFRDQASGTA